MNDDAEDARESEAAVRAYKAVLSGVLDQRPSGTRQRLADALGKHRSFVSQIAGAAYPTPIPAKHLPLIFGVCHFSAQERTAFLHHYRRAHPGRDPMESAAGRLRAVTLKLPDLGDEERNAALDRAVADFVEKVAALANRRG